MKPVMLSGDRPTGKLHLGHLVGSLQQRVRLQTTHQAYVMIADTQALTDHMHDPQLIQRAILDVAKDYLSVGINPEQTTIFLQSGIPELSELTCYFLNLVTLGRLARNPTVKTEMQQKGYRNAVVPAGFLCYPVSQAADITAFQANCVPAGDDQLPMIEQTNELVRRFNTLYQTSCLKECQLYPGTTGRLMGLDGQSKASKSLNNAIFLSDTPDVVQQKVMRMFTDPQHVRVNDPGHVAGNAVFAYLDAFCPDQTQVARFKEHYQKGGLGDTVLKQYLNDVLQQVLAPIRTIRSTLDDTTIISMLRMGTHHARSAASHTLQQVRDAMGIYSL
jgi:tryptophanyl-tRNA synthetase